MKKATQARPAIVVDKPKEYKFKLIKQVGRTKKGKVFDSFGGLVAGIVFVESVDKIPKEVLFSDKKYFKLCKQSTSK